MRTVLATFAESRSTGRTGSRLRVALRVLFHMLRGMLRLTANFLSRGARLPEVMRRLLCVLLHVLARILGAAPDLMAQLPSDLPRLTIRLFSHRLGLVLQGLCRIALGLACRH